VSKLFKALRILTPERIRVTLGARYRNRKRNKGIILTNSAEALATALRASLRANGHGIQSNKPTNDSFEILLLCKADDIYIVEANLTHIFKSISSDCQKINVIVDKHSYRLKEIADSNSWENLRIIEESEFKSEISKLDEFIALYNPSRQAWIRQQCLKTYFVGQSQLPILIIDSDTFLKTGYNPINQGVQLLLAGNDYHYPYSRHIEKFLAIKPIGLSFVHHIQLQQPKIVRKIYGEDVIIGLKRWLNTGVSTAEYSPISEFQTYGDYLLQHQPESVRLYFHIHHLQDAREFKSNLSQGMEIALGNHYRKCDCEVITLANKHLTV
jgi:hypothetical protein